jgi:threonine/homoserine/homoserine lactone efflux protein
VEPFLSFLVIAVVTLLIPGSDTLVVLRTALADGPRAGTWAAAGSGIGNLAWGSAAALGVATLLAASATAFAALELAGAAYLAVLGLQALRAAARGEAFATAGDDQRRLSSVAALRRGLTSDLLNVKVGLFWIALVPQFVTSASSPFLAPAMVGTMGALVFAWLAGYAHLAARVSHLFARTGSARVVNGAVGAVLLALGIGLALGA